MSFGAEWQSDQTFHNTDRFMRSRGFDLYNLAVRRYSHQALPSKYLGPNPSETLTGRPLQGDAIYLHDICSEEAEQLGRKLSIEKLLKLAAIASLAETPDTACQILVRFRERLEEVIDVPHALDLLD